jgi:GcrA cell cycle regulator
MHNASPWTDATNARLRHLWNEGLSTAEIGRRLNVSKNSVIGKAHRLELPRRPSPIKYVDGPPRQLRPRHAPAPPRLLETPPARGTTPGIDTDAPGTAGNAAPAITTSTMRIPPHRIVECCWPIGDPGTSNFRFCDAPALPGKPYCARHARLAYVRTHSDREIA